MRHTSAPCVTWRNFSAYFRLVATFYRVTPTLRSKRNRRFEIGRKDEKVLPELNDVEASGMQWGTSTHRKCLFSLLRICWAKKSLFTSYLEDENNTTPVCMGGFHLPLFSRIFWPLKKLDFASANVSGKLFKRVLLESKISTLFCD